MASNLKYEYETRKNTQLSKDIHQAIFYTDESTHTCNRAADENNTWSVCGSPKWASGISTGTWKVKGCKESVNSLIQSCLTHKDITKRLSVKITLWVTGGCLSMTVIITLLTTLTVSQVFQKARLSRKHKPETKIFLKWTWSNLAYDLLYSGTLDDFLPLLTNDEDWDWTYQQVAELRPAMLGDLSVTVYQQ